MKKQLSRHKNSGKNWISAVVLFFGPQGLKLEQKFIVGVDSGTALRDSFLMLVLLTVYRIDLNWLKNLFFLQHQFCCRTKPSAIS